MRGHRLITPDGREIAVDRDALAELQRARLLNGHRTRIRNSIYPALVRGLLSDRVRRHLGGVELTGPIVCTCSCVQCTPRVET